MKRERFDRKRGWRTGRARRCRGSTGDHAPYRRCSGRSSEYPQPMVLASSENPSSFKLVQAEAEPETDIGVTMARPVPETSRRAAGQRIQVPRTATQHTGLPFFWSLRINHVLLRII